MCQDLLEGLARHQVCLSVSYTWLNAAADVIPEPFTVVLSSGVILILYCATCGFGSGTEDGIPGPAPGVGTAPCGGAFTGGLGPTGMGAG